MIKLPLLKEQTDKPAITQHIPNPLERETYFN